MTADPTHVEIAHLEAERASGRARLEELCVHREKGVRLRAVRALGRLGDAKSLDLLEQLLGDDDPAVCAEAIRAFGIAGATDRAAQVARAFDRNPEAAARIAAITASPAAVPSEPPMKSKSCTAATTVSP